MIGPGSSRCTLEEAHRSLSQACQRRTSEAITTSPTTSTQSAQHKTSRRCYNGGCWRGPCTIARTS
eukprot:51659-Prorocentrum_minimum.AAC.1